MNDQSNETTIIDEDYIKAFSFKQTSDATLKASAERCFPLHSIWVNLDALKMAMDKFSSLWGFQCSRDARKLICNRNNSKRIKKCEVIKEHIEGVPSSGASRRATSIKIGCDFYLSFRVNSKNGIVTVTGGNYQHSEELGCIPSPTNLVLVRRASGWYSKLQKPAMDRLLTFMKYGKVTPFTLRKLFQEFLPGNVPIDAQFIVNMRIKAKKHLPKWIELGVIVEEDLNEMDDYEGLDNDLELFHDKATIEARNLMYDILNEEDNPNAISNYMTSLHDKDASFLYDLAVDKDNTLVGVIWQTAAMRGMFEDYGDVLFTDVMHRSFNAIHWPYISFTVLDSEKKIHVAIEGLICGEYLSGYTWVLQKLFEFSPKRSKELVTIIFADQFLSESALDGIGFQNRPLVGLDYWHLLEGSLPKLFGMHRGRHHWNELKPMLTGMINANNQTEFDFFLEAAQEQLRPSPTLLRKLNAFAGENHRYSKFKLFSVPGGLMRRGSVVAEQNHSSIVRRLDTVHNDSPVELICKLINRQSEIVKEKNFSLSKYAFIVTTSRLDRRKARKNGTSTVEEQFPTVMLSDARELLCHWGYAFFLAQYTESFFYVVEPVVEGSSESKVSRRGASADVFRLLSDTKRCDCQESVSMLAMCRHEIAYHKRFVIELFSPRWKFVTAVRCEAYPQNVDGVRMYRYQDGNQLVGADGTMEESRAEESVNEYDRPDPYDNDDAISVFSLPERSSTFKEGGGGAVTSTHITTKDKVPEHKDFIAQMGNIFALTNGNREIRSVVFGALEEIRRSLTSGVPSQQMVGLQQYKNNTQDFFSLFHQTESKKVQNTNVSLFPETSTTNASVTPNDPSAIRSPNTPSPLRIRSYGERENLSSNKSKKRKTEKISFLSTGFTNVTRSVTPKIISKKPAACGFCKMTGHRNSASAPCPKMTQWGTPMNGGTTETIEKTCHKYAREKKLDSLPLEDLCTKTMCHVVLLDVIRDPSEGREYVIIVPLTGNLEEIDQYKNKAASMAALCTWRNGANKKTAMLINGVPKKRLRESLQAKKKENTDVTTNTGTQFIVAQDTNAEFGVIDTITMDDIPTFMDNVCLHLYLSQVDSHHPPNAEITASEKWYDDLTADQRQLIDEQVDSCVHEGIQIASKKHKEAERLRLPRERSKEKVIFRPGDTLMFSKMRNPGDETFSFEKIKRIVQPTEEDDLAFMWTESGHPLGYMDCVKKVEEHKNLKETEWLPLDGWDEKNFELVIGELPNKVSCTGMKFGNYADWQPGNIEGAMTKKY